MINKNNLDDMAKNVSEVGVKAFDELKVEVKRQKHLLIVTGAAFLLISLLRKCCRTSKNCHEAKNCQCKNCSCSKKECAIKTSDTDIKHNKEDDTK